jgi:ribonuclease P protein component
LVAQGAIKSAFSRDKRLLNAVDFQQVFKCGKRQKTTYFSVVFCKNQHCDKARLGVVIPKKHNPLAVTRNRIRRVIRESFRLHQAMLGSVDLVIQVQRSLHNIENAGLYEDLNHQWQQLHALLRISS